MPAEIRVLRATFVVTKRSHIPLEKKKGDVLCDCTFTSIKAMICLSVSDCLSHSVDGPTFLQFLLNSAGESNLQVRSSFVAVMKEVKFPKRQAMPTALVCKSTTVLGVAPAPGFWSTVLIILHMGFRERHATGSKEGKTLRSVCAQPKDEGEWQAGGWHSHFVA